MKFLPSSILYYLVSQVAPKETQIISKNHKAAIIFRYSVKSLMKWLIRNINRLQIEIYGVERRQVIHRYPFGRYLVEISILKSVHHEEWSEIQL